MTIDEEIALRAGKVGTRVNPTYDLADQPPTPVDRTGVPIDPMPEWPIDPRYDREDQPDGILDKHGHLIYPPPAEPLSEGEPKVPPEENPDLAYLLGKTRAVPTEVA